MVLLLVTLAVACAAEPAASTAASSSAAAASAAPSSVLAASSSAPTDPCPATTAGLPESPLFSPDDPRLQGTVAVVLKEARRVALYQDGALHHCWPAGLAASYAPGSKQRRGDMRTPEGWYATSDKPWSQFYGAIAVHYPDADDARTGLAAGRIDAATAARIEAAVAAGRKPPQDTRLGGEILVHGGGGSRDWTLGCVALDDDHLDTLRAALPAGMRTELLILP